MPGDVREKAVNLAGSAEGKADRILARNLTRYFRTVKHERHEVSQLLGNAPGIQSEERQQLFNESQGGVTRWMTGGLDQRVSPRTSETQAAIHA